jgi:tripartite-type tricarboxylate transporter receptor subunit TctC
MAPAADYPARLVRLVVPFAPAGATDALSRTFAQQMSANTGQSVIIENRAGAGGAVGTEWVIKSAPDGHTLLFHSAAIITDALLKKDPTYEVRRDLAPVTTIVSLPTVILVNNQMTPKSVSELIALARQSPKKLNYGTPGLGSSLHLATELFLAMAGVQAEHVPYKGGGPVANALLASEIDFAILTITSSKPLATSGKVRALAVSTAKRAGFWPELPTASETGLPDYDLGIWYGLLAPIKTPTNILNAVHREAATALQGQAMREWSRNNGMDVVADSREEFSRRISRDVEQWSGLIRKLGLKAE